MPAYLVVRIKGTADVPHWASTTLRLLRLEKKYRATIVPEKPGTLGMLKKVQHYVAWKALDGELAGDLMAKKARGPGYRPVSDGDMASVAGGKFGTLKQAAASLASGESSMSDLSPLKPWFALSPPRGGFRRSTKRLYGQKGVLGHNPGLDSLVRSMI